MSRRSRTRRREIAIPLASMGDIAFLLIIFFIVCSTFMKESGRKVTPPRSRDIDILEASRVRVTVDEKGDVYLNGEQTTVAALENNLAAVLAATPGDGPDAKAVMFRCDRGIGPKLYLAVIQAIANAGGNVYAVGQKIENATPERGGSQGPPTGE